MNASLFMMVGIDMSIYKSEKHHIYCIEMCFRAKSTKKKISNRKKKKNEVVKNYSVFRMKRAQV
jgi:hypothetical protein